MIGQGGRNERDTVKTTILKTGKLRGGRWSGVGHRRKRLETGV
jgi:hypothetical protein